MSLFKIITVAALMLAASVSHSAGPGYALDLTQRYQDLLDNVANPSPAQIASACGTDQRCAEGLRRDAESLRDALDMLDESRAAYRDAIDSQSVVPEMLGRQGD